MASNPIYQIGEVPGDVLKGCRSYRVRTDRGNYSVYVIKRAGGYAHYVQTSIKSKIYRQFAGFAPWMTNEKLSAATDQIRRVLTDQ